MGGNALKQVKVVRKTTEDYQKIYHEISKIIKKHLLNEIHLIKCYHTKESHGDMDILVRIDGIEDYTKIRNFIYNIMKPQEVVKNDKVYSFNYYDFQIDFILVKDISWETAMVYFDYDCLGNIMGKTYHKFNLSYGWDGLFYKFRNFNGRLAENILISNNPQKIFEFGDYDYDRYLDGFDYIEEIFEFVQRSKYFDNEMFKMENLKHIDKKRNRKRGSYHLFLKYLEENNINRRYEFHKDKDLYLPMIEEFFPEANLMSKLNDITIRDKQNKVLSQKFNGDIVMSWLPDLQGKELGQAISKFKFYLGDEYDDFILNSTYKDIYNRFMEIYNEE